MVISATEVLPFAFSSAFLIISRASCAKDACARKDKTDTIITTFCITNSTGYFKLEAREICGVAENYSMKVGEIEVGGGVKAKNSNNSYGLKRIV